MVEKAEFTEKKYQDVQRFLLEFPSRNNNLINNEQIKDLVAMFRVMRTDSPDLTSYYDDAGTMKICAKLTGF